MAEVIELLSSSPAPPPPPPQLYTRPTTNPTRSAGSSQDDVFNFESSEFDISQPPKRRKLSPVQTVCTSTDAVFDLSSDVDDFLPLPPTEQLPPSKSLSTEEPSRDAVHIDDFNFSSSAPEPSRQPAPRQTNKIVELSSDDDDPTRHDPIRSSSQPPVLSKPTFSNRTANLLAGLNSSGVVPPRTASVPFARTRSKPSTLGAAPTTVPEQSNPDRFKKVAVAIVEDILNSSQTDQPIAKKAAKPSKQTGDDKVANSLARAASKAEKDAEKEAEKQRKKEEKELKQQEKQRLADVAEVNKSKTNKKNSTPEMIIDMPESLKGKSVGNQVEEYMKELEVTLTWKDINDLEVDLTTDAEVLSGHIITWRRKITAEYDEDEELWRPISHSRTTKENHITVYLKAEEFVRLAVIGLSANSSITDAASISESKLKSNLDAHVASIRTRFPKCTIIYLIEGLNAWHRKSQTAKNRSYTAAVRSQAVPPTEDQESNDTDPPTSQPPSRRTTTTKRKTKAPTNPPLDLTSITEPTTELLLLHLQLTHQPLLIHQTTSPTTTAAQITSLTTHLSTRPYRLAAQSHNLNSATFCMTTGQIRTGSTPGETYINMLQEINRVTPSMAYGIRDAGYTSVSKLVKGFEENGKEMLQDVRKSVNRDGGWSDRRLGPMVSKRLWKVFMGRDDGVRDGIA